MCAVVQSANTAKNESQLPDDNIVVMLSIFIEL